MFVNSGTTPDGRKFYRTEGVLLREGGHTVSGHIVEIDDSGGGEPTVNINAHVGIRKSMDAGTQSLPVVKYVTGYYHQSTTRRVQDNKRNAMLFCFADEEPNWTGDPQFQEPHPDSQHDTSTPFAKPEQDGGAQNFEPGTQPEFDPADTNKDGTVSKREQKQHNKR